MSDPRVSTETWVSHQIGAARLRRVVEAFAAARIDILPVKGILTGRTLYADVAERPISDVDLRIRPRDVPRAIAVGRAQGWITIGRSPRFGEVSFVLGGMLVELEAHVGRPGMCAITVDELLSRAVRSVAPFGFAHLQPETNDHALVLCLNAFKDRLPGGDTGATRDLERIVALPEFDAATLAERASRGGVATAVWLVADWLARERGAEAWTGVRDLLGSAPPDVAYARAYRHYLRSDLGARRELLLVAACPDGAARKLRSIAITVGGWAWGGVTRRARGEIL
jgi:hypothetical protein